MNTSRLRYLGAVTAVLTLGCASRSAPVPRSDAGTPAAAHPHLATSSVLPTTPDPPPSAQPPAAAQPPQTQPPHVGRKSRPESKKRRWPSASHQAGPMTELEKAIDRGVTSYIATIFAKIEIAERAGFIPVASDAELEQISAVAYYGSRQSIGPPVRPGGPHLFKPDSHPYVPELRASRSYFVGGPKNWDFIRHVFTIEGIPIVVTDGVNEAVVHLVGRGATLASLSKAAQAAQIAQLAARLFAERWSDATWLPRGSQGDVAFTTARGMPITESPAGKVRMDAGVRGADLYFVFYKLHTERQNTRMNNPADWFRPRKTRPRKRKRQ